MISIDSSTKMTGLSIWNDGILLDYKLLDYGEFKEINERFKLMSLAIINELDIILPDIIYIEDTVVPRNVQTQRLLTRLQGVIYGWCITHNCDFHTIRPTQWRKLCGFKQGKKVKRDDYKYQAIQYVKSNYNLEVNDDIADSICIGDAALKLFGGTDDIGRTRKLHRST